MATKSIPKKYDVYAGWHDKAIKAPYDIVVFYGTAHPELGSAVAKTLDAEGRMVIKKFADGEIGVNINDSIRNKRVFIIQPTCPPANDNLMELLIMIDSAKRASAKEINIVMPYFGYARQDKKIGPREPITASLVAKMIQNAGANRVIAIDLHAPQIQGFFDIPVDHLYGSPILEEYYLQQGFQNYDVVVVSPDASGASRARVLAEALKAPIAIITKRRPQANVVEVMEVIGDVNDKTCIMIDDMIDTGGTILHGAEALKHHGANDIHVACTHGLFSGNAGEKFDNSSIKSVIALDTMPVQNAFEKLTVLNTEKILYEAIKRIAYNESVSELFE